MLQRCPREVFLKNASDYSVDPKKGWLRVRGTLQHSGLEKYPDGLIETKWEREIEIDGATFTISGTVDVILPESRTIRDWKTVKSIKSKLYFGGLPSADHIEQLSLYRWLIRGGKCINPNGQEVNGNPDCLYGEIVYIDPEDNTRYSNIPLWEEEVTEKLIRARLPLIARMLYNGEGIRVWRQSGGTGSAPEELTSQIAPVLPEEDQWKCRYCDVLNQCQSLSQREGTPPVDARTTKEKKDEIKAKKKMLLDLEVNSLEPEINIEILDEFTGV